MSARKGKDGEPKKKPQDKKPGYAKSEKVRNNTGRRGAKKTHLTDLEKILISNGGPAHATLRRKKQLGSFPKRRQREAAS